MKRHYEKLDRVSAATDTTPPTTFTSSTLARDRKRKHPLVDNFKIPMTSKLLQNQLTTESTRSDLISLPTKDSDVQSILRRMPELQSIVKLKSGGETEKGAWKPMKEKEFSDWEGGNNMSLIQPTNEMRSENRNKLEKTSKTIVSFTDHDLEAKYLKFVSDITKDVLASSISSDRALNMLFERHIAQNKTQLNEAIMRARVRDLKVKLNIKS